MQVLGIMRAPQTVDPEEYATHIRALLRQEERIVVVTREDRFLGMITRKDAMQITSTRSNVKAREIMSQPVLIAQPDEEVHTVGRKMIEKDVYSALVMKEFRAVGVVHIEDIIPAVYHPSPKKVRDIMTRQVISCDRKEEITKVWDLMEFHNFTGLPVTEEVSTSHRRYKKLVGFITKKDILRTGKIRPGVHRHGVARPPTVEKAMNRTPKYIHPADSIAECVELLQKHDVGRLPVVQNGFELVGIVDREDILRIYV